MKSKEAIMVFKNMISIGHRYNNTRISFDQTVTQRQYFKLIKEETERRKHYGENIISKFFSGVPVIKRLFNVVTTKYILYGISS